MGDRVSQKFLVMCILVSVWSSICLFLGHLAVDKSCRGCGVFPHKPIFKTVLPLTSFLDLRINVKKEAGDRVHGAADAMIYSSYFEVKKSKEARHGGT